MAHDPLPIFIAGLRVGWVRDVTASDGGNRGRLTLDNENTADANVIKAVVRLAQRVHDASPERYQAEWKAWRYGCDEIQDLGLRIGNGPGPVEEFSIERDWTVEWRNMPRDDSL